MTNHWINIILDEEVTRLIAIQQEVWETSTEMHRVTNIDRRGTDVRSLDGYQVFIAGFNTKLNDLEQEQIGIELQLGKALVESFMEHHNNRDKSDE